MSATSNQSGRTMIEVMVSIAIFSSLLFMLGTSVTTQANVMGDATDVHSTVVQAEVCLQRIRNELKSAVQGSPGYAVSETSITWRPMIGYISPLDANYNTKKAAGLVSANNIEYDNYTRTISYDSANNRIKLQLAGTVPSGLKTTEELCHNCPLLAGNVSPLRFLQGDTAANPPAVANATTVVLLVRVTATKLSTAPGAKNAANPTGMIDSNVGGVTLSTKIRMFAELLVNSTRGAVTGA